MEVTRGDEKYLKDIGNQIYGDGKRFNFGGEHTVKYMMS